MVLMFKILMSKSYKNVPDVAITAKNLTKYKTILNCWLNCCLEIFLSIHYVSANEGNPISQKSKFVSTRTLNFSWPLNGKFVKPKAIWRMKIWRKIKTFSKKARDFFQRTKNKTTIIGWKCLRELMFITWTYMMLCFKWTTKWLSQFRTWIRSYVCTIQKCQFCLKNFQAQNQIRW